MEKTRASYHVLCRKATEREGQCEHRLIWRNEDGTETWRIVWWRTVWTQTNLTERRRNGNVTYSVNQP